MLFTEFQLWVFRTLISTQFSFQSLPPPQKGKREKEVGGKTEAEVEAERKAKAEKDEEDFQVGLCFLLYYSTH